MAREPQPLNAHLLDREPLPVRIAETFGSGMGGSDRNCVHLAGAGMIRYIGDIHARDDLYARALKGCDASVQVGDFGFGFIPDASLSRWPGGRGHRMIRGNHDDPARAEAHPGFIDSGYEYPGTFYVNGGFSIDRQWRIEGVAG
jgi:hypothetical protein